MKRFDPDPLQSLGYQVRATHRAFARLLQRQLAPHGLNNGFWYVLRVLWEKEGLTQRELADEVNLRESSMMLMVKRTRDRTDKRRIRTHLTAKSRKLKTRMLPNASAINEIAAKGVTKRERAIALDVLRRMRSNLERSAES
jgi:MarR family transcriptional regulator, organic hydroperoxide resistance regulator